MIALRRVKNTERIPIVSGDHKGPPASLWRRGIINHIVGMAPGEDDNAMFHLGTTIVSGQNIPSSLTALNYSSALFLLDRLSGPLAGLETLLEAESIPRR